MAMRRREFITALGGVVTWSLTTRAQQPDKIRRVGVLMGYAEDDPEAQARLIKFRRGLARLGWNEGSNLHIDARWSAGEVGHAASFAKELVALNPDVILSNTTPVTAALQHETSTIPIVFVQVSDPIGSGFVESLARPGGNITGFLNLEASMVGKWLELLKEIAPRTTRVAVMFNPQTAPYLQYYLEPLQAVAPKLGVTPITTPVASEDEIEVAITNIGREQSAAIIAMTDSFMFVHRKLIVELTEREKVPSISFVRDVPLEGGLISYGVDGPDLFARAAPYVDHILRGAKPAALPVQAPTKFELVINLQTAQRLGLTVPPSLIARADEVIE
jgi:putative tryptophan/tyrosine transport system substrate-binding protein